MALLLPWFIFLFVGAFDWGYYAHALISTEAAARTAGLYASTNTTSASDTNTVCKLALGELKIVPNVNNLSSCNYSPVITSTSLLTGSSSPDGNPAAQVTVQYTTLSLIPIPGLLKKQATFYRVVKMRLRG